ncbi:MAG: alpha/beta hydrolase, partial [Rubrimonas sp.]
MSPQLAALTLYLRLVNKPQLARETDLPRLRDRFTAKARLLFRDPRGADFREIDGATWCGPRDGAGAILYLHGGGFIMGSPRTHRHLAARVALAAGAPAMVARYRLAPEHPHPAQIEDALAAYAGILGRGPVAVAGDSAGGGLAFALVVAARAAGLPDPACVVGFSPWCDMTGRRPTLRSNAR